MKDLFVVTNFGGRLLPGVYQRYNNNKNIRPLLIFIKKPNYRKRFNIKEIAEEIMRKEYPTEYKKSLQDAVQTIRITK